MAGLVGVTGATGDLGRRIAQRLSDGGVEQRLIVRNPARVPRLPGSDVAVIGGYEDAAGMRDAFRGVDTLLLTSAAEHPDRVRLHKTAVDAAADAGVARIVYTSFLGASADSTFTFARDHFHTEEHIRASGVRFVFLRNNIYLDFIPLLVGPDGVIRGPAGDGAVAAVAKDDIADVAAVVLPDGTFDGTTLDLTGPSAFTLSDAAAALSEVVGRPIGYHPETLEEAYESRAGYGAEPYQVDGWVTTYVAIANGELAGVTNAVLRVTGHRPVGLREWLAMNRDVLPDEP